MKSFKTYGALSRRTVLRGAGVALTLPWLESLQPREARAQAAPTRLRFLPIFLPCGAPDFWKPQSVGAGNAWALSSVLEPFAALKAQVNVISGLENASVFNVGASTSVEPAARQAGAWLTCVEGAVVAKELDVPEANGISVDQLVAASAPFQKQTPINSLQVGLSTTQSYCDARPCSDSRSVSWRTPTSPLFKTIDPKAVFDQLVGAGAGGATEEAVKRRANELSVLDAVLESAGVVRPKLSASDKVRMDAFLDSVRSVERRVDGEPTSPRTCNVLPGPIPSIAPEFRQNSASYNKGLHADVMNDLIAMAFACDSTRVISYMLEDERSEFSFNDLPARAFTETTSAPSAGFCYEWGSAQHGDRDVYATITWWNVGKVAQLCQKLANIDDGDGRSVLDNCAVFLGSAMHGSDFRCADLPAVLIGGGGGAFRTNQHVSLTNRPLRDLYFTLMNEVFAMNVTDFGVNRNGAPLSRIVELLA